MSRYIAPRPIRPRTSVAFRPIELGAIFLLLIQASNQVGSTTVSASSKTVVRNSVESIRDDLAPQIRSVQKHYSVPGLSLIVVRGQDTLWAEGFGYADKAKRQVATLETVYRAGSLAKPFTAVAVMQLAEAGKIDIDEPLDKYLPQFSIRSRFDTTAEPLSVRSVLTHHSGLPADLNKGMWSDAPFTSVAASLSEEYSAFPPKLVFSYSNLGYTLLGHMVQAVSGKPFSEYMEKSIFDRWNMKHTGMRLRSDMEALLSKGYRDGKETELLPIRDLPAHGLYTSAEDLGVFMRTILAPKTKEDRHPVLSKKSLQVMFEPQNLDVPLDLDVVIGLGWFLEHGTISGAGRVVRHGGTTLVFSSELILLPDQGLGVAVLANSQGARTIVSRLAEEILARLLESGAIPGASGLLGTRIKRDIKDAQLAEAAGNYATDFGLIAIRPEEGLCACIVGQTLDLIPYPDGWFAIAEDAVPSLPASFKPLAEMRFQTRRIDDREVIVAKKGDKQIVLGEKVPQTPVPQVWLDRVGDYELLNPDDNFPLVGPRLRIRDGQLCMSYKMPLLSDKTIQLPLRPISDTEAIILGLGRTRGETLSAFTADGEERLRYSGFVGRKRSRMTEPALKKLEK